MIDRRQRFHLAPDVVLQSVGVEALLLKLHDEAVFTLNETGARIARLISEGFTLEAVTQRLSREYQADQAEVKEDVVELAERLIASGLIVPREEESS